MRNDTAENTKHELGSPVSRRRFIALAGGSAVAAALLPSCGGDSASGETSQFGDGDVGVLNYLLTLEHLEASFYANVIGSGLLNGPELVTMHEFGKEETEHVSALTKAVERLGRKPAKKPSAKFPLRDARSALGLAGTMENMGAAAYLGQLPNIESSSALATMLSIHSVEGRHSAAIYTILGRPITPDGAFAEPATAKTALKFFEPFMAK